MARVTLRLSAPQCPTDPGWEAERPASAVYRRVVLALHDRCTAEDGGPLTAPGFIVCFHLIRHVLETDTDNEDMMIKGLKGTGIAEWRQDGYTVCVLAQACHLIGAVCRHMAQTVFLFVMS